MCEEGVRDGRVFKDASALMKLGHDLTKNEKTWGRLWDWDISDDVLVELDVE